VFRLNSAATAAPTAPTRWDLDAEAVVVKIRWFGLMLGHL